jgi:hypothetical protein
MHTLFISSNQAVILNVINDQSCIMNNLAERRYLVEFVLGFKTSIDYDIVSKCLGDKKAQSRTPSLSSSI